MRRDKPLVSTVKSVIDFSTAFEESQGVSILAARMVDIAEHIDSSDILFGNNLQTYHRYILVVKMRFQRPDIFCIIENMDEEETGSRTLGISRLEDGTLVSSRTEKRPLLVRAASQYVPNPMKHKLFHTPFFYKSGGDLLRELHDLYQERDTTGGLSFSIFLPRAPSANKTITTRWNSWSCNNLRLCKHDPFDQLEK